MLLKKNVTVEPTEALLATRTKALLDFSDMTMLFSIAPGVTLQLTELELINFYGLVGPGMNIIRQSPGGRVAFNNCVTIRRAGLPTDAAVVNMLSWPRPAGVPGPQRAVALPNLTYNSTRSTPQRPMFWNRSVALMVDYQTTLPSDSSLAFQGLYLGGYTYSAFNTIYFADNLVDPACLATRPGDECVSALLRKLNAEAAAQQEGAPAAAHGPHDSGLSKTDTIVVAVVVPVGVVLLAAAGAAVLLTRRRRAARRAAAYGKGSSHQTDSSSSVPAKPGDTPSGATRSSDIFMGLEAGVAPPEWTAKHEQEVAAGFPAAEHDDEHALDEDQQPGAAMSGVAGSRAAARGEQRPTGTAANGSCVASGMRPAFAAAAWAGSPGGGGGGPAATAAAGGTAASASLDGNTLSSAGAAAPGAGGTRGRDHFGSSAVEAGVEAKHTAEHQLALAGAAQAAAVAGAAGRSDEGGVTVQPAEAPRPSDVAAELSRMAREVRMQVKDVAIRIDTVLGTGAFGVVYGGIWQGIPVAVKTVVISASAERRKRALQEAALCQSIVHPNIIATYACELQPIGAPMGSITSSNDSGVTGSGLMPHIVDWRLYIIQELADGGPLSKLYGSPDIWPAPSAPKMVPVVALGLGIARAVAHLHSKRIIHGDLSPNNVMLKKDAAEPSGFAAKVGDFGLSVMLPQNQSHLSNLRMGTMFYMCPAVILKGQVGPASDVFSLGVILWELFHGRRAGVMTREGPRYAAIFPAFPPSCPQLFVSVALNCLQKQPANRPSAETVAQHLDALLQSLTAGP
ncbi:hypothetical protein HYH02_008220 [Chlamydomonas schloesseri]|uniref:Protein kinase domain-containing protein n=1 Tax=Chlamydomonas schloesseri TaxID=2026947 RepID=A0A836B422_9CHLO|nr:hypothetical protein HYH02_008220 [Chlamydomonas schloesseri]|eukprot:KAG2446649.1 hypothetical protein HYH02_008220 [Chlamydomonas schloesseri]